jgi:hypothetical protein
MKKYIPYILGILIAIFGLLTLYLSGSVIFDLFDMRTKQGDYVLPVIWANFIASIFYLIAAYGFFTKQKITCKVLMIALITIVFGGVGLYFHIKSGGTYMPKTIKALGFRFTITLLFFTFAKVLIGNKK